MSVSNIFAQIVALIGGTAVLVRRSGSAHQPAWGSTPAIPPAKSQGSIPTLKMPTAQGWPGGQTPVAAPGLKVNAFATDLKHPRWICALPNGDVSMKRYMGHTSPLAVSQRCLADASFSSRQEVWQANDLFHNKLVTVMREKLFLQPINRLF